MNKKMVTLLGTLLALVGVLSLSSPVGGRAPLFLLVFALVYTVSSLLIRLVLDLAYGGMPVSERRFIALVLAFSPTILLALSSLSTLSVIDIVLAIGVPVIVIWYGVRRGAIK